MLNVQTNNQFQNINMVCEMTDNLKYVNPFRDIVYINSSQDFIEFIHNSIHKVGPKRKIALCGRINHEFASKVFDETGLNISQYRLLIESKTIEHIYQKHCLDEEEKPLSIRSIVYFGEAISNYLSMKYYANTDRIEIFSEIDEELHKIILALDLKHANVYLVTLFKANEEVEQEYFDTIAELERDNAIC